MTLTYPTALKPQTANPQAFPVGAALADHFGDDPLDLPIVTEMLAPWDHVNVQAGLDAYLAQPGRSATFIGATVPPPPGGAPLPPDPPPLASLLTIANVRLGSPDRIDVSTGTETTMSCINMGLVSISTPDGPLAVWIRPDGLLYGRKIAFDVQASSVESAQTFLDELRLLMIEHSRFRGKVIKFSADIYGNINVEFEERPNLGRDQVILPPATLEAIEGHAIGIAELAPELRAVRRHLKRGLLLYGPPGGGKTHTIRYLTSRLPDATLFLLTGTSMGWLRFVAEIAADLAPAVIVLDDVDLIAEDRNLGGMSPRRHLFDLLDAMDGLHEDSDVLFVCTTNRPETLEKALSARPGRVDQAVEIPLPDADCRRRLITLYAEGLDLAVDDMDSVIARTEGVTGSFVKELLRRAAVVSITGSNGGGRITVTDGNLHSALDSLLDPANPLTHVLLGGEPESTVSPVPAIQT